MYSFFPFCSTFLLLHLFLYCRSFWSCSAFVLIYCKCFGPFCSCWPPYQTPRPLVWVCEIGFLGEYSYRSDLNQILCLIGLPKSRWGLLFTMTQKLHNEATKDCLVLTHAHTSLSYGWIRSRRERCVDALLATTAQPKNGEVRFYRLCPKGIHRLKDIKENSHHLLQDL